jgi:hypothetical protein
MADSYYTSKGAVVTNAVALESQSTGANVPTLSEIIHPDSDGIFHVKESDPKAADKNLRMVAYQSVNAAVLGPSESRALALAAQKESSE